MDATTMPKTNSLAKVLSRTFPDIVFVSSDDFRWSPEENTVYYGVEGLEELLHETSHALLSHVSYENDIDLIKMERDAWTYAQQKLAPHFDLQISDNDIEDSLDSYRDWLHARSRCPHCSQTGIQTSKNTYECLGCNESWQTNEARRCALRRYTTQHSKTPA